MKLKKTFLSTAMALFANLLFAQFGGGNGTQSDPYKIATYAHFVELSTNVNGGNEYVDTYFIMTNDVDFENQNFTPIGNNFNAPDIKWFKGFFDGNNHNITNFKSVFAEEGGLAIFGGIKDGAIVKNTHVKSGYISGTMICAGIVGYNWGGEILGCSTGSDLKIEIQQVYVGGIAGINGSGAFISKCVNYANIAAVTTNGMNAGGITAGSNGVIEECANYGSVKSNMYSGGITSFSDEGTTIKNCYNVGDITANSDYASGIISALLSSSKQLIIENCYNYGVINSPKKGAICVLSIGDNTFKNNHYDDQKTNATCIYASEKHTTAEMTNGSFANTLNSTTATCWIEDNDNLNNKYPIFNWLKATAINKIENLSFVKIYGANGKINLVFDESINGVANVYNIAGMLVASKKILNENISIQVHKNQIYLVTVTSPKGVYTQKIFVE